VNLFFSSYFPGDILPIMSYMEGSTRKSAFSKLQVFKKVGILQVEVYERKAKNETTSTCFSG